MSAPGSGKTQPKFDDADLASVFTGGYRRERGKIEITAAEIAEILTEEIIDKSVSRQAVDKRLQSKVGTQFHDDLDSKLVRVKHGRSYHYRLEGDLNVLPADGGEAVPAGWFERNLVRLNFVGIAYLVVLSVAMAYIGFEQFGALVGISAVLFSVVQYQLQTTGNNKLWRLGELRAKLGGYR